MRTLDSYLRVFFSSEYFSPGLPSAHSELKIVVVVVVIIIIIIIALMISGPTVTTAWRVLGLRIEETASRYGG
jgi:hypothetical protein